VDRVRSASTLRLRLGLLGACSAALQTLIGRELLSTFLGNEAILAAFFGHWLVFGALGAVTRRRRLSVTQAGLLQGVFAVVGAATLVAVRLVPALFPLGAAPGFGVVAVVTGVVVAPVCWLGGRCFAALSDGDLEGRAYLAESVGAALAGAALSLVLLPYLAPFEIAGAIVVVSASATVTGSRSPTNVAVAIVSAALGAALIVLPVGRWAMSAQGASMRDVTEIPSDHGLLAVARGGGQQTVYLDRQPIVSGRDDAMVEQIVDLPLGLHPAPRDVALVGGLPPGGLARALAHGARRVDWLVEDDTLLAVLASVDPTAAEPRVHPIAGDVRRSLASRKASFDVVTVVASEPTSIQTNRLFTEETFRGARAALRPGGVFALSLPGFHELASDSRRRCDSSIRRTLEAVFGDVRVLPGGRTTFLARVGAPLPDELAVTPVVSEALAARGIASAYLTPTTMSEIFSSRRVEEARRWTSLDERVNRDLAPTTYRLALDDVLLEVGASGVGTLALLALAIGVGLFSAFDPRRRPAELAVGTSGAAAQAVQLVLMVAFQAACGALYRELGLLLSGFMTGAAAGAWAGRRLEGARIVVLLDLAQVAVALSLAASLPAWTHVPAPWLRVVAFAASGLVGALPGAQFAAACRVARTNVLWAADLVGAGVAAFVTIAVVVPWAGLAGTLVGCGVVKAASAIVPSLPKPAGAPGGPVVVPVVAIALGVLLALAAGEATFPAIYAASCHPAYAALWIVALLLALVAAFEGAFAPWQQAALATWRTKGRDRLGAGVGRVLWAVLLLPAAALSMARCYFTVPFVLCHVCPRQCVFGVLRPYVVSVALVANIHDRHFCQGACPVGMAQVGCGRVRGVRATRIRWASWLGSTILVAVAVGVAYAIARGERQEGVQGEGLYALLFRNTYAPSAGTIVVSVALVVLSLFVWRPFCEAVCPIGAASGVLGRIEAKLLPGSGLARKKRAES
jgi:spermidine synthase